MTEKIPMTKEGLVKLKSELDNLKNKERPNIIRQYQKQENMEISQKMQNIMQHERKQSFIEGRISELENKISRADVIDTSSFR